MQPALGFGTWPGKSLEWTAPVSHQGQSHLIFWVFGGQEGLGEVWQATVSQTKPDYIFPALLR